MNQLILDINGVAIALPESQKGAYKAWGEDLSVDVVMITGRMVKELCGTVWRISYQYGYFNDIDRQRVISAMRKGRRTPIICSFLPPESNDMITSTFFITASTEPKFMWSSPDKNSESKPLWGDFSLELREVYPHA